MNDVLKQIGATERVKPVEMYNRTVTRGSREDWTNGQPTTGYVQDSETGQMFAEDVPYEDIEKISEYYHNPYGSNATYRDTNPEGINKYHLGVEITPELREIILNEGLPHFHEGGEVDERITKYDKIKPIDLETAFKLSKFKE
jgi:hypothetical protein